MEEVRTAGHARKKRRQYGRARARRRRALLLLGLLGSGLLLLPFLLKAPETLQRLTHPLKYEETIREASAQYGLEPALVAGVVHTESRFDPEAESHQEAYGLMQLMPQTASFISSRAGIEGDYRNPRVNLRMGTWYLSYLNGRYAGHERLMLAAYNSGEGQVDAWISEEGFDIERDIPFDETRNYVENVLEARDVYAELYGRDLGGG